MDKVECHAVIKYLPLKGMALLQIHQGLIDTLGDSDPSYATVKHWVGDFQCGRESVEDERRPGRPSTATTNENMGLALNMIMQNS